MARSTAPTPAARAPARLTALISARQIPRPAALQLLRSHGFRDPAHACAAISRLHADALQRRTLAKIFSRLMHACARSADPDRALLNFERLVAALPNPNIFYHYLHESPERLELLVRLFAHSQALADTLTRNAEHFHFLLAPHTLQKPREKTWLAAELHRLLLPIRQPEHKYDAIRRFRRRETLRIGARDLIGAATVEETTLELSNLADVCLQAVFEIALQKLCAQHKLPEPARAAARRFAIIGMGKLGGQELNYSSDVDVIFIYGEEGQLTPTLSHHQFFTKLAEEIIRAVGTKTDEGTIFRIDLRLRPEGATGPLVRSLESCENYYAGFGETWERMALVKARPVAGDPQLGTQFVEMVQPFVYARHATDSILQQMAALKTRIENEILARDQLTRHVKLGIGGIREIEFIVQSFQVLRGARLPALRERNTLRALSLLAKTGTLSEPAAAALAAAYRFLRSVEHRLQMEMELQTHTIPDERRALLRLSRSLGYRSVDSFLKAHQRHTQAVRKIYEAVLAGAGQAAPKPAEAPPVPEQLPGLLKAAGFNDVPAAVKILETLWHGPGFVHVSQRTKELFAKILPTLMACARQVADPDAALARFERFVAAYGSRGLLYELFSSNPKLVEMLMRLGDASRYLSEALARQPELFDELCRGVALSDPKDLQRMRAELLDAVGADTEPMEAARLWKRAEMVRIGIEDVMGLVDLEQLQLEITSVAEACLRLAVEQARRELKLQQLPFAVIGMGKFGGEELGYGADLDVMFVGGTGGEDQPQAGKVAARVMEWMSRQTRSGMLFAVDPRLRPDGEKGPLASSLEAHRQYYRQRAQLWERQALIKARFVAGDEELGRSFLRMASEIVYAAALTPQQLEEIKRMRHRIQTERGDPRHPELEFKTGPGGLVDVEFAVQTLQLRYGPQHKQLRTPHTLAALNRLTALGLIEEEQAALLRRNYRFLRKIESTLRRQDNTSISKIPAEPREQLLLARRLGFDTAAAFLDGYRHCTRSVRALYEQLMRLAGATA